MILLLLDIEKKFNKCFLQASMHRMLNTALWWCGVRTHHNVPHYEIKQEKHRAALWSFMPQIIIAIQT